jgi:Zn-dependent peptidase ImmA (M78 family)
MALDLQQFGAKLRKYRDQLKLTIAEVAGTTGISTERLEPFESGQLLPTGDEILILADFYRCDYRFFISNERLAPFEQTENLYRRFGDEFSKEDRWRVQEFLFLCECEEQLLQALRRPKQQFKYEPKGNYFKGHAEEAAALFRRHFRYSDESASVDIYGDLRKLGVHIFRRRLENSNISGLTVQHPFAGACILVNYSEDIYRQTFTVAHEAAHVLLDNQDVVVSFSQWKSRDLVEVRANTFASRYLLPPTLLKKIPVEKWNGGQLVHWAAKLKVSSAALAIGLKESEIISDSTYRDIVGARVSQNVKTDPELAGFTGKSLDRKKSLLESGLSSYYVSLCFDAIAESFITNARAAEMLLLDEAQLGGLAEMFHVKLVVHE